MSVWRSVTGAIVAAGVCLCGAWSAPVSVPSAEQPTPPAEAHLLRFAPPLEAAGPPSGVRVHAEVFGVPNDKGFVSASLCTKQNFTKAGCRTARVPARSGHVDITFDGVEPGRYAVQVLHDQNGNQKMDFTFLGLPKEPYGFSRDAKPVLSPPKFRDAGFDVAETDVSVVINLQNL